MELSDFARKWSHPDYPPERVNESDLIAAETELGIKFPEDYRAQVLNVGLPRPTLALLSAIVDRGMELNDLSVLHNPKAVVENTNGWQTAGMPKHLIAIGSDSSGSSFCFDVKDLRAAIVTTVPVYFWDHDFGETQHVASSFSNWISSYVGSWCHDLTHDFRRSR